MFKKSYIYPKDSPNYAFLILLILSFILLPPTAQSQYEDFPSAFYEGNTDDASQQMHKAFEDIVNKKSKPKHLAIVGACIDMALWNYEPHQAKYYWDTYQQKHKIPLEKLTPEWHIRLAEVQWQHLEISPLLFEQLAVAVLDNPALEAKRCIIKSLVYLQLREYDSARHYYSAYTQTYKRIDTLQSLLRSQLMAYEFRYLIRNHNYPQSSVTLQAQIDCEKQTFKQLPSAHQIYNTTQTAWLKLLAEKDAKAAYDLLDSQRKQTEKLKNPILKSSFFSLMDLISQIAEQPVAPSPFSIVEIQKWLDTPRLRVFQNEIRNQALCYYQATQNHTKSIDLHEANIEVFEQNNANEWTRIAEQYYLALLFIMTQNHREKSLDFLIQRKQISINTRLLTELAYCYRKLDRLEDAYQTFKDAIALEEKSKGKYQLESSLIYLEYARLLNDMKKRNKARFFIDKVIEALSQTEEPTYKVQLPTAYQTKGNIALAAEEAEDALEAFKKERELKSNNDPKLLKTWANNMGIAFRLKANYDSAQFYYEKALEHNKKATALPNAIFEYKVYNNIANMRYHQYYESRQITDKYEEIIRYFKLAEKRLDTVKYKKNLANLYLNMAKTYLYADKISEAEHYFQLSQVQNKLQQAQSGYQSNMFNAYVFQAQISQRKANKTKQIETANNYYQEALSQLKSADSLLQEGIAQADFLDRYTYYVTQGMRIAYKALEIAYQIEDYNNASLFYLFEKGKANVLRNAIKQKKSKADAHIPEKIQTEAVNLYQKKIDAELALHSSIPLNENYRFKQKLFEQAQKNYDNFFQVQATAYPDFYAQAYEKSITLEQLQAKLTPNDLMLQYAIGFDYVLVMGISDTQIFKKAIPIQKDFDKNLDNFISEMKYNGGPNSFKQSSYKLYQQLIAPIREHLNGKENLIIIPDAALQQVPFEALIERESQSIDFKDFPFLVHHYNFTYHYAAAFWLDKKTKQDHAINFTGFAPIFEPDTLNEEDTDMIVSRDMYGFEPLPNSKEEVVAIAQLFKNKSQTQKTFLASKASKQYLIQQLQNAAVVHIATHSYSNKNDFQNSFIALAGFEEDNPEGKLTGAEIANIQVNSKLVVLSSCQSGAGRVVKGEGLLSLARSFIFAGAPNIVYALWNIDDRYTPLFMLNFYKRNLEGLSYAQALRQAKLESIKNEKLAHPGIWAAFMFIGE
ncbi:MAG: CHAT domain-containing protein [Bernardetiaceae bacterium]|nr:CHAT domain-containing protein [Bernardetiaceae bacterium]